MTETGKYQEVSLAGKNHCWTFAQSQSIPHKMLNRFKKKKIVTNFRRKTEQIPPNPADQGQHDQ